MTDVNLVADNGSIFLDILKHSLIYVTCGGAAGCTLLLLGGISGWLFKWVVILVFKDKFKSDMEQFNKNYPSFGSKVGYIVFSLFLTIFATFASVDILIRFGYMNGNIPLFWVGFLNGVGAIIALSILIDYREEVIDFLKEKVKTIVDRFLTPKK